MPAGRWCRGKGRQVSQPATDGDRQLALPSRSQADLEPVRLSLSVTAPGPRERSTPRTSPPLRTGTGRSVRSVRGTQNGSICARQNACEPAIRLPGVRGCVDPLTSATEYAQYPISAQLAVTVCTAAHRPAGPMTGQPQRPVLTVQPTRPAHPGSSWRGAPAPIRGPPLPPARHLRPPTMRPVPADAAATGYLAMPGLRQSGQPGSCPLTHQLIVVPAEPRPGNPGSARSSTSRVVRMSRNSGPACRHLRW